MRYVVEFRTVAGGTGRQFFQSREEAETTAFMLGVVSGHPPVVRKVAESGRAWLTVLRVLAFVRLSLATPRRAHMVRWNWHLAGTVARLADTGQWPPKKGRGA